MAEKYYLTKKGLEKVKKEYEGLKKLRISKTTGDVPKIWQSEDLNPEYISFQEDLGLLETRLAELDFVLKNYEIIKIPSKDKRNIVELGSTVTLEEKDGSVNEFMILGTLEANPSEGKISSESPVGKALLGKKLEEEVMINSPIKIMYKVKKIKYSSI